MLREGQIKEFKEMKYYISKINFRRAIGIGNKRMNDILSRDISSLSFGEMLNAANLLKVDFTEILEMCFS